MFTRKEKNMLFDLYFEVIRETERYMRFAPSIQSIVGAYSRTFTMHLERLHFITNTKRVTAISISIESAEQLLMRFWK